VAVAETSEDGRSARSQRTRDAVVESLLAWLRDGNLRPTAKDIADRAGISVRSVYVHFDDLDDLFCAAAQRQGQELAGLIREIPIDQAFEARLEQLVAQRARAFERVMPIKRAAALQEPFSKTLSMLLDGMRRYQRAEIERVFAAEIERIPVAERMPALRAADLLAVEETWSYLRTHGRLTIDETVATVTVGLRAILRSDA
jgi:AcrR family transcriptional regulator